MSADQRPPAPGPAACLRRRVGDAIFLRVAGPEGYAARERIHGTPGPRWFASGSPIQQVHADAAPFAGGLRALLLQSLHPLAMAGVAGHSGYRSDPWGRLERTATFLATTAFATADDVEAAVAQVRGVHERVRGRAPDGRAYRASDPHLLTWVHIAEADSFLTAHQRYGQRPLTPQQADEYVAQIGRVAGALGAENVPTTVAELHRAIERYRPELEVTAAARDTATFLLDEPPLPWFARPPYRLLAAGAVSSLPGWARDMLDLDTWFVRRFGRPAGGAAVRAIRWALGPIDVATLPRSGASAST